MTGAATERGAITARFTQIATTGHGAMTTDAEVASSAIDGRCEVRSLPVDLPMQTWLAAGSKASGGDGRGSALVDVYGTFLRRLLLFLLPCVLAFALPLYVIARAGEIRALDLDQVVDAQVHGSRRLLFGPAFSDCTSAYKLRSTLAAQPEILAMGSSRVMPFRSAFFTRRFYNAGGANRHIDQFSPFLARIPREGQPSILIVGLDHYFFNGAWHQREADPFERSPRMCTNALNVVQRGWWRLYLDWANGRFGLGALDAPREFDAIGLSAMYANGFRNDGSYYYGRLIQHQDDPRAHHDLGFRDTLARIRTGTARFEYADHLDPKLVADLAEFLQAAAERGMHVVALLPPLAPLINDRLSDTGRYGYMQEIPAAVRPLVEHAGGSFFDFTDIRALGMTDQNFIDGFHCSERAALMILLRMAESDPWVAASMDADAVRSALAQDQGPLDLAAMRWH